MDSMHIFSVFKSHLTLTLYCVGRNFFNDIDFFFFTVGTQRPRAPFPAACGFGLRRQAAEMKTDLPAFLTNPTSASTAWQMSQQKQSGCQLLFMALMTRPMMNSPWAQNKRTCQKISSRDVCYHKYGALQCRHLPHWWQQGAKSIWKSCSQYFRPSNCQKEFREGKQYESDARTARAFNQETSSSLCPV